MRGILYLEDGTVYKGKGFGAQATKVGELVFNTAMSGYQKTLTDPSYSEQIITMTYPLIGNYGINADDYESDHIFAFGLVAKDVCFRPSNWRCEKTIDGWLKEMGVPGVYDVDTREITRKVRNTGNQKCVISTEDLTLDEIKKLCEETELRGDQMKDAGVKEVKEMPAEDHKYKVAVIDLGIKRSILKELNARGCDLTVFPYGTKAKTILAMKPDGVFVSNGPGDPEAAKEEILIVEKLITNSNYGPGQMPVFGICMGHQIIALSQGGRTYKLKYGHRGCNHGVFDKKTGRSYITSQNHGYIVEKLPEGARIIYENANDGTCEGLEYPGKGCMTVQFMPDGGKGAAGTGFIFDSFVSMMEAKNNA